MFAVFSLSVQLVLGCHVSSSIVLLRLRYNERRPRACVALAASASSTPPPPPPPVLF